MLAVEAEAAVSAGVSAGPGFPGGRDRIRRNVRPRAVLSVEFPEASVADAAGPDRAVVDDV